jgi:hypothetical protein
MAKRYQRTKDFDRHYGPKLKPPKPQLLFDSDSGHELRRRHLKSVAHGALRI